MNNKFVFNTRRRTIYGIISALIFTLTGIAASRPALAAPASTVCPSNDSGITLPPGFCATIFADGIGHTRHIAIAHDGTVFVNTWSGRYFGNDKPHDGGFVVALRDTTGSGHADIIERFGETVESGGHGGTGIALYKDFVYVEESDKIVRYRITNKTVEPQAHPDVIVSGLPLTGDHPMHPFVIDARGNIFVDVASATNACQTTNRTLKSAGMNPCTELETRAGVWKYDANKIGQTFSPAQRYATGIRNADGLTFDSTHLQLFVTQHGRDQLGQNWPDQYTAEQGAILPSEEFLKVRRGGDYGWPQCYYDPSLHELVLAPEYGGDGKKVGLCANKLAPVAAFPAHWAPNDVTFYYGKNFPSHYEGGVFIAFHGSWNRAPFAQAGFNLVFQKIINGAASGSCEIFADGFAGSVKERNRAEHRPTGLAVSGDGALFVADDVKGRIYRITFNGDRSQFSKAQTTPCPKLDASAGEIVVAAAGEAPAAASLRVPEGSTKTAVALGDQVYHGQVGGAACTGCHGSDGSGTTLGPNLTSGMWVWSDGSFAGLTKIITDGVATPRNYRAAMPPMGGAQLSPDQVSAVAAYVWGLSHTPK